ncbi:hypothetical protein [Winogradskyella jejuensis]|uniref:Uncharacterized protein n=1 Tax=Winogradskyella jejuensis TaxID=1089305 RepID=A0A1M5K1I1_9FLAO|nr:hypothetical protein [Winogradskyella jejuensis]SHG46193.1 hypothetical protein SAMN05444148_0193 [Winogradskyella jejuensis]
MKKLLTFLLIFITSVCLYSQDFDYRNILKKSIPATKDMSVVFNFKNTTVRIEESNDGKLHLNYALEFKGYSRKQIAETLEKISIKTAQSNNHITLEVNSNKAIQLINYSVDNEDKLLFKPSNTSIKTKTNNDSVVRISKDSLLKVIQRNRTPNPEQFLQHFTFFKGNGRNNMFNEVSSKRVDIMKSKFIIKIPPFIRLNINAENSNIYFGGEIQNELSINQTKGKLNVEELRNLYNNIKLDNVLSFDAESIVGGTYNLKSVYDSNIASISQTEIKSEFSKIKIGEIGKLTKITDFNSEYWFYNWSTNFERFNLFSEYSKIHLFYPKANHSMKVIGNNTKNIIGQNFVANLQPTKTGKKYTMITRDPHPGEALSGDIYFDIVHGIIYTHEDSIKTINK